MLSTYSTPRDRSTRDGGYAATMRRIERHAAEGAPVTSEGLYRLRMAHHETPRTERGPFWYGSDDALWDAMQDAVRREEGMAVAS
jgi:hypothetical protein